MGPRSTAPFVDLVLDECQRQYGARFDIDFPPMLIYSLPTPFYVDRPLDHIALEETILAGLRKLEASGVAFVAMPCNSAHIYFDRLAAGIHVPLLNMVDLALAALPAASDSVALLATRPTLESRLYQAAIERMGLRVLAGEAWQARVDALILAIKSSADRAAASALWRELIRDLEAAGADTLLLACTDLNAVSGAASARLTLVDATRCLAAAVVGRWLGLRKAEPAL
ncbi:MAG TPA: aspartate/glutamate racemase family protein [Roseiflexaceae bacterium]|nr:aspartate/glutamate racemase family protein [Roseiflexaceae bacterium]